MDACICMAESLHCSSEAITVLLISCTPIVNKKFKFKQKNLHVIIKHSYEKNFFQVRKAPFGLKLCWVFEQLIPPMRGLTVWLRAHSPYGPVTSR